MDPHLRWLRGRIVRSVAQRLAVAWLAWSTLAFAVIATSSSASFDATMAWAVLLGEAASITQAVVARRTSSLSPKYLRSYLSSRPAYVPTDDAPGDLHPTAVEFERYNLRRVTMHDPSIQPAPVFDVLQTPDHMVTVVVGREAGSLAFLSETDDGRIVYSSDLAIPPTAETIVNWVPGGDVDSVALAHREFTAELQLRGIESVGAGVDVFTRLMAIEHAAYDVLGTPFVPFLDIGGRRSPLRLSFRPKPEELREQSVRIDGSAQASRPSRSTEPPRISSVGPPSQSSASA